MTRLDYQAHLEAKGLLRLFGPLFVLFGRLRIRAFCRSPKALAEGSA